MGYGPRGLRQQLCHNSHVVKREAQAATNLLPICIRTASFSKVFIVTSVAVLLFEWRVCHIGVVGTLFHCSFALVGNSSILVPQDTYRKSQWSEVVSVWPKIVQLYRVFQTLHLHITFACIKACGVGKGKYILEQV